MLVTQQSVRGMRDTKRNTKAHNFIVGDQVFLKEKKRNIWSTAYEPAFYTVRCKLQDDYKLGWLPINHMCIERRLILFKKILDGRAPN